MRALIEKTNESLSSVIPITAIVLLLSISIAPLTPGALILFLFGAVLLVAGMGLRADEKVTIAGFGRFEMRPRKPKAYTNPKTKVSSRLESTSIPGFKASGRFKQKLESGRAAKSVEETA